MDSALVAVQRCPKDTVQFGLNFSQFAATESLQVFLHTRCSVNLVNGEVRELNRLASADVDSLYLSEGDCRNSLREHLEHLRENLGQLLDGAQVWQEFLSRRHLGSADEHDVLRLMRLRASRAKCFGEDLFHDPAWDILLDLYAAKLGGRRLSVSDACIGSQAPATTGLRWLTVLEQRGLIVREADGRDGRRVYVLLTKKGLNAMQAFFQLVAESRV